ncbi:DUF4405 domain-containing protein [Telmatospirillum siberiense]|nr:DUF4405 domain-containing protein [Telmatospirillum siberiense]
MTILMLLAFAYQLTGNMAHEFIGFSMALIFLSHNTFNYRWYTALTKITYSPTVITRSIINIILLSITVMLTISGILNSHIIFSRPQTEGYLATRQFHTLMAYWFLILSSLHLGMHWKMIMAFVWRRTGIAWTGHSRTNFLRILSVSIAVCGAISSFDRGILSKLTAEYSFDYWNFDEFTMGFFAEYIAIMGMYSCFAYYALKLFKKLAQPRAPSIERRSRRHE